jgi:hypothetical protein
MPASTASMCSMCSMMTHQQLSSLCGTRSLVDKPGRELVDRCVDALWEVDASMSLSREVLFAV